MGLEGIYKEHVELCWLLGECGNLLLMTFPNQSCPEFRAGLQSPLCTVLLHQGLGMTEEGSGYGQKLCRV